MVQDKSWELHETGAEIRGGRLGPVSEIRFSIVLPLAPLQRSKGQTHQTTRTFTLYGFRRWRTRTVPTSRTLFCPGGPGEVPDDDLWGNFLDGLLEIEDCTTEFIYFHPRGCGLSQISLNPADDDFLRASLVVQDINQLKAALITNEPWTKKPWNVIGFSYGTVIAQRYAHDCGEGVDRLILAAPLSRHRFKKLDVGTAATEFKAFFDERHRQMIENLRQIYSINPVFAEFSQEQVVQILGTCRDVLDEIPKEFGSLSSLLNNYDTVKKAQKTSVLEKDRFYSREFFVALRDLKRSGWLPISRSIYLQVAIGFVVAAEVLGDEVVRTALEESPMRDGHGVATDRQYLSKHGGSNRLSGRSLRAYSVFGFYDGVHVTGVQEVIAAHKNLRGTPGSIDDVKTALDQLAQRRGMTPKMKTIIGKVNPSVLEKEWPWDPKDYSHSCPTLVLDGLADPVTVQHQAEHLFHCSLTGDKILIKLPGVGHGFHGLRAEASLKEMLLAFLESEFAEFSRRYNRFWIESRLRQTYDKISEAFESRRGGGQPSAGDVRPTVSIERGESKCKDHMPKK